MPSALRQSGQDVFDLGVEVILHGLEVRLERQSHRRAAPDRPPEA